MNAEAAVIWIEWLVPIFIRRISECQLSPPNESRAAILWNRILHTKIKLREMGEERLHFIAF